MATAASKAVNIYFLFLHENIYIVGTHLKHLCEALLMNTHNLYFQEAVRKILGYSLLSGAMLTLSGLFW